MKGFTPGLFDRLLGVSLRGGLSLHSHGNLARMSVEDMKDAVARDLEALLNTRAVLPTDYLTDWPECER